MENNLTNNLNVKWILYCTACTENGKIYIGVHSTEDPNSFDGYIGCGIYKDNHWYINHPVTPFHKAVKKYGFSKFKRAVLKVFDNEDAAYQAEREQVTEEFIKRTDNYNTATGGKGGSNFSHPKQYDLEGNFIKEYLSVAEICEALDLSKASVDDAMSRKKPLKGFYFISKGDIMSIIKSNEINSSKKDLCISSYDPITKKLVKTYSGIKIAAKEHKCDYRTLKKHLQNGEVFKDVLWSFGYSETYTLNKDPKPKKVAQYDLEGNLIKIWDRVLDCAKEHPKVRDVLKGVRNKTHGFTFKYIEE